MEEKKHKHFAELERASIEMTGEQFTGLPILDTEVKVNGAPICWITWADKEAFLSELQQVIDKYKI